ncbi:MAG TPA: hypothetical protein VH092_37980 [Urbifossiella sp.]|jgi:hypothetical protein|nr:hypothetical protein [Urbifossiella sp.]
MLWFTKSVRPGRPAPALRTRLQFEQLDARAVPSSLDAGDPTTPTPADTAFISTDPTTPILNDTDAPLISTDVAPPPGAPTIASFTGQEDGIGFYFFSGQVQAGPSAAGLTVTFGGVPSLRGQTTVTASDGSFGLYVMVKTDGSDNGTVTAQATANGQTSNVAMWVISPA